MLLQWNFYGFFPCCQLQFIIRIISKQLQVSFSTSDYKNELSAVQLWLIYNQSGLNQLSRICIIEMFAKLFACHRTRQFDEPRQAGTGLDSSSLLATATVTLSVWCTLYSPAMHSGKVNESRQAICQKRAHFTRGESPNSISLTKNYQKGSRKGHRLQMYNAFLQCTVYYYPSILP